MLLSHQLSGRKGEYVRATSAVVDGFLHATMYHALSDLEQNLREHGYPRPMLIIHNSGGMAQLNSTDALQTIHSGPVAGISASEHLAAQGYRLRVPYGTLLCVSDKPLHGEIKLPGAANAFYETAVTQHLQIGLTTVELLKQRRDTLHSRKLRSFDEPPFR